MATHGAAERRQMAGKGQALPGGRFPISDESDLRKAIMLAGHAKGDKAKVQAYIKRRAATLNLSRLIPDDWK